MKKTIEWVPVWNELKRAEGGEGTDVVQRMKDDGIKARSCHSVYVGHICVEVPVEQLEKAKRWIDKEK